MAAFPTISSLKTAEDFCRRLAVLGVEMPFDADLRPDGPLAQPIAVGGRAIGNRFCILPMEGWDAETDGRPSERTVRRRPAARCRSSRRMWSECLVERSRAATRQH